MAETEARAIVRAYLIGKDPLSASAYVTRRALGGGSWTDIAATLPRLNPTLMMED